MLHLHKLINALLMATIKNLVNSVRTIFSYICEGTELRKRKGIVHFHLIIFILLCKKVLAFLDSLGKRIVNTQI